MTLTKALELLDQYLHHSDTWSHQDLDDAIRLGISAINRIKACRPVDPYAPQILLPGETEE